MCRAGAHNPVDTVVARFGPALVAQLDFCHAADRYRRAGPTAARLATGNACGRTDRLPCKPKSDPRRGQPDAANHLSEKRVFERSMPSDLIRGWIPVASRKRQKIRASVLIHSEPIRLDHDPIDHDLISLFEHDLFGKPVPTFPDQALARWRVGWPRRVIARLQLRRRHLGRR